MLSSLRYSLFPLSILQVIIKLFPSNLKKLAKFVLHLERLPCGCYLDTTWTSPVMISKIKWSWPKRPDLLSDYRWQSIFVLEFQLVRMISCILIYFWSRIRSERFPFISTSSGQPSAKRKTSPTSLHMSGELICLDSCLIISFPKPRPIVSLLGKQRGPSPLLINSASDLIAQKCQAIFKIWHIT